MQSDSSPKMSVNNDATTSRVNDLWAKDLENLESLFNDKNKSNSISSPRDKSSVDPSKNCLSPSNLLNDCTNKSTDNSNDKSMDKSDDKSNDKAHTSSDRDQKESKVKFSEDEESDEEEAMEVEEADEQVSDEEFSDEQEDKQVDEPEDEPDENREMKKSQSKKRKKKAQFERRNIKKLIKDEDLNQEILAARKEEEKRINRILEQQKQLKTEKQTFSTPSISRMKSDADIVLSSDEEEVHLIDSSDEDEDIVISYERIQDELDPTNSGLHTDDSLNTLNANGRCLINVGHPSSDPDVFLDDYLAQKVKPHQIGGIRFMYDCIIENLTKVKISDGIGGCILAHSMGLGKTLQIVAFTELYYRLIEKNHILVIVPVNTIQNWRSEYDLWLPDENDHDQINESCIDGPSTSQNYTVKMEKGQCKVENEDSMYPRKPRQFKVFTLAELKTFKQRMAEIRKWYESGGVLLIGYEIYRMLYEEENVKKHGRSKFPDGLTESEYFDLLEEAKKSLMDPGPDLVVCDEGHRIKNCKASISLALKKIRTKRRIILTGYPLQNNLIEYWCMVDFIRPGYLGKKNDFTNMFERPIVNGQCIDSEDGDRILARKRAHVLHKLLIGFVQRRSFKILFHTLPPKHEFCFYVRMTTLQKNLLIALYQYLDSITDESVRKFATNPIHVYSVCYKIWNSPDLLARYMSDSNNGIDIEMGTLPKKRTTKSANSIAGDFSDEEEISYEWANELMSDYRTGLIENSVKMMLLFEIVDETIKLGERLLIFSQSLYTLDLIEYFLNQRDIPNSEGRKFRRFTNYFRLDGSTSAHDRKNYIDLFNNDNRYHLFLISTKAGSLGINLTGANRLVVFDISFNPCHDAQAVHRIYRYGQKKKCYVYRFIFDNSLEKRIFDRQIQKQGMSNQVVDEMNTTAQILKSDIVSLTEGLRNIEDAPIPVFSENELNSFDDPIMRIICKKYNHHLTKKPLPHESLLAESEETKLSRAEKQIAEWEYNREVTVMRRQYSPRKRFEPPTQNYQESQPSTSGYAPASSSFYNPYMMNNQTSFSNQNYTNDFHMNPAFNPLNPMSQASSNYFSSHFEQPSIFNNNHQLNPHQMASYQDYNSISTNLNAANNQVSTSASSFGSLNLQENNSVALVPAFAQNPSSSSTQSAYSQFNPPPTQSNPNVGASNAQYYTPNPSMNNQFIRREQSNAPRLRKFVISQDMNIKDKDSGTEISLKRNQTVLLFQAENSLLLRTFSGKKVHIRGALANFFNAANQTYPTEMGNRSVPTYSNSSPQKSQRPSEVISLSDEE